MQGGTKHVLSLQPPAQLEQEASTSLLRARQGCTPGARCGAERTALPYPELQQQEGLLPGPPPGSPSSPLQATREEVRPARAQTTGTAEPVALRQLKYGLGPSGPVGGLVVAPASHRQTLCSARSC
ncbi:hypothetical protein Anapl_16124 [Anas platyrhynchos]|uniref:Uncharacterized protein n=1 Tax=Anas platyrhynchos TaxID=8839 RepID=R0KKC4_ANAPL|nr:hypothetical protein Anapl_16124 [Anas platyrhynchos]